MIKVLHVAFSSNPGGVENCVMNYYRHINKDEFSFDFLDIYNFQEKTAYYDEITKMGSKVISFGNFKKHPLSFKRKLTKYLKNNKYDIVHIHMQSAANLLVIKVCLKLGIKVIAHSHSTSTPKGLLRKILHSMNVKKIRKMNVEKWACSLAAGKWLWGEEFDSNNILANAIDASRFYFDKIQRENIRNTYKIPQNAIVIGFVGRFGDEKNTLFLIDILKALNADNNKYHLLTVGGNDYFDDFVEYSKTQNMSENTHNVGIVKDTSKYYSAFDFFLQPSFFEGFPLVTVEALASGCKCLLSNRITKEIDILNNITFLPVDKKEDAILWKNEIEQPIDIRNEKVDIGLYDILNSAVVLEKKYKNIVERK